MPLLTTKFCVVGKKSCFSSLAEVSTRPVALWKNRHFVKLSHNSKESYFFFRIYCAFPCPKFSVRKFWLRGKKIIFRKPTVPVVSRELAQGIFVVGQAEGSCTDRQNIILEEERSFRYLFLFYSNFIFTLCNSLFVVLEYSVLLQEKKTF